MMMNILHLQSLHFYTATGTKRYDINDDWFIFRNLIHEIRMEIRGKNLTV